MAHTFTLSTQYGMKRYVESIMERPDDTQLASLPGRHAQHVLDEIWKVLDSQALPSAAHNAEIAQYRNRLRRLSIKIVREHDIMPAALVLQDVQCTRRRPIGGGAFSHVFRGAYQDAPVALKTLRKQNAQTDKMIKQDLCRESVLWRGLVHENILPFLGVAENVMFRGSFCMVMPLVEHGSVRSYISRLRQHCELSDAEYATAVDHWLCQTACGLEYLHSEGIVHSDLHAGNILVGDDGHALLTDFGLSLISEATAYNYGSKEAHGGGMVRFTAPELFDPQEYGLPLSTRPTYQSDMYAFAFTCIELYTGDLPFPRFNNRQISHRVVRGERPSRPSLSGGSAMSDGLWLLVQSCWVSPKDAKRPSAAAAAEALNILTSSHVPFTLPPLPARIQDDEEGTPDSSRASSASESDPEASLVHMAASDSEAQEVVDGIWNLLTSSLWRAIIGTPESPRTEIEKRMLEIALKIGVQHRILPKGLVVKGVQYIAEEANRGTQLYSGMYRGVKVALKVMKIHPGADAGAQKRFHLDLLRTTLSTSVLDHENIVPILGIAENLFPSAVCIVYPWTGDFSIKNYYRDNYDMLRKEGIRYDDELAVILNKWLSQTTVGLEYLHEHGIVHGDLNAGSILIDKDATARLTDFDMRLISKAFHYGTGRDSDRWTAPELIDPEEFDLETSRPTPQSDMFSLACTGIEIYSCQVPFHHLTDLQIYRQYMTGRRPVRPSLPGGQFMSDGMWSVLTSCWTQQPTSRPSASDVVSLLVAIVEKAA